MQELLDAWAIWWTGQRIDVLWGVKALWWGRIGQILQLVGALMIVAEIVGADRLRRISDGGRLGIEATFRGINKALVRLYLLPQRQKPKNRVVFWYAWGAATCAAMLQMVESIGDWSPLTVEYMNSVELVLFLMWIGFGVIFGTLWFIGLIAKALANAASDAFFKAVMVTLTICGLHFSVLAN